MYMNNMAADLEYIAVIFRLKKFNQIIGDIGHSERIEKNPYR